MSVLAQILSQREKLLDFASGGVRIRDRVLFDALPTRQIEVETAAVRASRLDPFVLGCLAGFRRPFSREQVDQVVRRVTGELRQSDVDRAIDECLKHRWLRTSGRLFEVGSHNTREALESVARDVKPAVHAAIFAIYEEEHRPLKESFAHLLMADAALLHARGRTLIAGLRELMDDGAHSKVQSILAGIGQAVRLPSPDDLELALIEMEIRWRDSLPADRQEIDRRFEEIRRLHDRDTRDLMRTRLALLASRAYARRGDHAQAVAVASLAERGIGPFRSLRIRDHRLSFEFHLNLWEQYYRTLDRRRFVAVDDWLWSRLAKPTAAGDYDWNGIAEFVGLFLKLHQEFRDTSARQVHFHGTAAVAAAGERPLSAHPIEVRTRIERLRGSFFDQQLMDLSRVDHPNRALLALICFDCGVLLAARARTDATAADSAVERLTRAEALFTDLGLPYEAARAWRELGNVHWSRIQGHWSAPAAWIGEECVRGAQAFELAAAAFDGLGAIQAANDSLHACATLYHRWADIDPSRRAGAITAFETLVERHAFGATPETRDDVRLALHGLYEREGQFARAAAVLSELEIKNDAMIVRGAKLHAEALRRGNLAIDEEATPVRDLEALRHALRQPASGAARDDLTGVRSPIAIIAWHLMQHYRRQQQGIEALAVLREARAEIVEAPERSSVIAADAPAVLSELWRMEDSTDDQLTQDFVGFILPFAARRSRSVVHELRSIAVDQ